VVDVHWDAWLLIPDVEPPYVPPLCRAEQDGDVLIDHLIPYLKVYASDYLGRSRSSEGFEAEEVSKNIEVWRDAEEGFA